MNLVELYKRCKPSYYKSLRDLTIHVGMLSSTIYAMWYTKESYMSYALVPLLSLLNTKSFIILHHCGHYNFIPNKKLNYIIGQIMGISVLTPFCWTYDHTNHHSISGNKENKIKENQNHSIFHTFKHYERMNIIKQYLYKIVRQPFIFNTIFSTIVFTVIHRFHILFLKISKNLYNQSVSTILYDTIFNNIMICIQLYYINSIGLLGLYIISVILFSTIGFSMFHNQHTFNPHYVTNDKEWTKENSGLKGSSFIQLPNWLSFFFYGDQYHHVHHMLASIPPYHLKDAHEYLEKTEPEFKNIVKLSMNDCYHNLWLTLYDEEADRYISFKEADDKIKNKLLLKDE